MNLSKTPDLKSGQMITIAYIIGMLIVLFIVYKILAATGLIKTVTKKRTEAEQKAAIEMARTDDYFDPMYWYDKTFKSLGKNAAEVYAQDIHNSIYGFLKIGTNAEKIFSTLGKLYNKCNVSELATSYILQYDRDMRADLLNNLTKQHISDMMNILNSLPER
jgi:hypothetical protein